MKEGWGAREGGARPSLRLLQHTPAEASGRTWMAARTSRTSTSRRASAVRRGSKRIKLVSLASCTTFARASDTSLLVDWRRESSSEQTDSRIWRGSEGFLTWQW